MYLEVVESPGCSALRVDGHAWPYALGVQGRVVAGIHKISCADGSNEIQFDILRGTEFRLDYWGP